MKRIDDFMHISWAYRIWPFECLWKYAKCLGDFPLSLFEDEADNCGLLEFQRIVMDHADLSHESLWPTKRICEHRTPHHATSEAKFKSSTASRSNYRRDINLSNNLEASRVLYKNLVFTKNVDDLSEMYSKQNAINACSRKLPRLAPFGFI